MYYEKLVLENYASIWVTMQAKKITIDFTERKNKICLLEGPNGSGKTSILSALTPFATYGNLDVRDNLGVILKNKNGYKEVVIVDKCNRYVIKHFYTASKDTHTVKSYIEKNGMELNQNGNVTSFKEIVKEELDLEMDYLKLIRLGSNVTNMLDLKTTERKNFMSKLLNEVEIYLKYHKKVSKELLQIKSIISHILDKIHKSGITDYENSKDVLKNLKSRCEELLLRIDDYKKNENIIRYNLENIGDIKELNKNIQKLSNKISKLESKDSSLQITNITELIENTENTIKDLETKIIVNQNMYTQTINQLDSSIGEEKRIKIELDKIENDITINSLESIIDELENKVALEKIKYGKIDYPYTKEEFEEIMAFFKEQQEILNKTYEFGTEPIQLVISLMKQQENVVDYIKKHIKEEESSNIGKAARDVLKYLGKYEPNDSCKVKNSCSAFNFYGDVKRLAKSSSSNSKGIEFYTYMELIYTNIRVIFDSFYNKNELFKKMPESVKQFSVLNNLFKHIEKTEMIYDQEIIFDEYLKITGYDNYLKLKEELNLKKIELKNLKKNSHSEYLNNRLIEIQSFIIDSKNKINEIKFDVENYRAELIENKNKLEDLKEVEEVMKNYCKLKEELDTMIKNYSRAQELINELTNNTIKLNSINFEYKKCCDAISNLEVSLNEFKKLNKELKKYQENYDNMILIRDSLSSKEGIPLLYIQMYLQNTKDITNDLLDKVYYGRLYIEDFNITADEFKIPFVRDDMLIKDVSYASQGELSFLSIALSFALSSQSLTRYNVMLLDEMDSMLDTTNREKFIAILEHQIDIIEAEQIFLISHNNMFSNYPIDVITTNNEKNDNNMLVNYITIKKE